MKADEKILITLQRIKDKVDLSPTGATIDYRAGWEATNLGAEEEIMILNKLAEEGVIEVVANYSNEYM